MDQPADWWRNEKWKLPGAWMGIYRQQQLNSTLTLLGHHHHNDHQEQSKAVGIITTTCMRCMAPRKLFVAWWLHLETFKEIILNFFFKARRVCSSLHLHPPTIHLFPCISSFVAWFVCWLNIKYLLWLNERLLTARLPSHKDPRLFFFSKKWQVQLKGANETQLKCYLQSIFFSRFELRSWQFVCCSTEWCLKKKKCLFLWWLSHNTCSDDVLERERDDFQFHFFRSREH